MATGSLKRALTLKAWHCKHIMIHTSKRQRRIEVRNEIRRKSRTISDVDDDLERTDCPLFKSIEDFVCDPSNMETSVRLMRHLIVEQVILGGLVDGIVIAFKWLVRSWPYKAAYELHQAFLSEFNVAARLEKEKFQKIAEERAEEFKVATSDTLRAKKGFMLAGRLPKRGRPSKRSSESLPPIPEEEQDTK